MKARLLLTAAFVAGGLTAPAATTTAAANSPARVLQPATITAAVPTLASRYQPVGPVRIADTRKSAGAFGYSHPAAGVMRVKVAGRFGVPANASEAVVNVWSMNTPGASSLTVYSSGQLRPSEADVIATAAGQTVSNVVHVRLNNGSFDIAYPNGVQIAVDLQGVYVPVGRATSAGRLVTFSLGQVRVLTSFAMHANTVKTVSPAAAGVPVGALAAVVNLTVDHGAVGSWTAFAEGKPTQSAWAMFVDTAGLTRTTQVIVPLNPSTGRFQVWSRGGGRISVDVVGYYTGAAAPVSTDGLFLPTYHLRRLDTRPTHKLPLIGPVTLEFSPGTTLTVQAVAANIITADSWDPTRVIARPAGVAAHSVEAVTTSRWPQTIARQFISRTSTRGIALTTDIGGQLVVDVTGWFLGPRPTATLAAVKNRALKPVKANAVKWSDANGTHARTVYSAGSPTTSLDAIADAGVGAAYYDMSTLDVKGNLMVFAHRTKAGTSCEANSRLTPCIGMFRYVNTTPIGSIFSLRGTDGHWYRYRVMYRAVVPGNYSSVFAFSHYFGPITAQLVACSKPDGTPTDTRYRIVVTGRLIGVV